MPDRLAASAFAPSQVDDAPLAAARVAAPGYRKQLLISPQVFSPAGDPPGLMPESSRR